MNKRLQGILLVLLSAAGFGLMPFFAVGAYEHGVTVQTLLLLRFIFATLFFFGLIRVRRETWKPTKKHLKSFFLLGGVMYMLQSTLYFTSVKWIPSSLAALLLYTYPAFVCLLAIKTEKRPLRLNTALAVILSFAGIGLVLGAPQGTIRPEGILAALGAAVVYSLYITVGNRVVSEAPSLVTSAYVSLFASGSIFLSGLLFGELKFDFEAQAWPYILGVSLFSTVIAMLTFFLGMSKIGSTQASILSTFEPLVTIGVAVAFMDETMRPLAWLGSILVLSAAVLSVSDKQEDHAAPESAGPPSPDRAAPHQAGKDAPEF
ncbi:DMT family transporter [Staphylospora marina]|uniref:DMT family transporter n=1 Tax=Staphylospora marina TaxID=2490858 RepID=UPI0013DE4078|nr:EamA family transporter [Staphylospora marina]